MSKTMNHRRLPLRRRSPLPAAIAAGWLVVGGVAQGASQGPVADAPYVGTLPCADCTGVRNEERPIATSHEPGLRRDATGTASRLDPPRALFRGTLSREADRLLLEPCDGGPTLWVHDVSPEVMITAAITDIGFDERGSFYLEAYGNARDGELWIDRLNRAGVEMGCPRDAIGFHAQGNEPGWSLASDGTAVRFATQDGLTLNAPPLPLTWRWPGGRPDRAEAVLVTATEGSAFEAVLAPRICRDTMADAVFGFTATIRLTRPQPVAEFKGCAFLGSETLPGGR